MVIIAGVDWSEVTALATIALVIAAVIAAVLAKRDIDVQLDAAKSAQQATRAAQDIAQRQLDAYIRTSAEDLRVAQEATRTAQETAQHQIEASYRPLLIDVSEHMRKDSDLDPPGDVLLQFPNGGEVREDWRKVYVGVSDACVSVAVPLRNVGAGPAVIDKQGVRVFGDGVNREILGSEVHRERVPPNETTRILCTQGRVQGKSPSHLDVLVPYSDFAGAQARVAMVHLEHVEQGHWRVGSIELVKPEDIAP